MDDDLKLVPQEQYAIDIALDGLPDTLIRKCCVGKPGCGNTHLEFVAIPVLDPESPTGASVEYNYVRQSNGDAYFRQTKRVADLVTQINDPKFWPVEED